MARFDQVLSRIEDSLAASSLAAAAVIGFGNVVLRYAFNQVVFWGEEAVVFLIIFSTFIGAVITLRHNKHVGVDVLAFMFKDRGKWILAMLGIFFTVFYCAVMGGYAWLMVAEPSRWLTQTRTLGLPLWFVQLSVPIGLTLMFVRSLEILYRTARHQTTFPEAEELSIEEEV